MALYDVFISYSRNDTQLVNSLIVRLRHDIPDIKIWYDIEGIESADAFKRKIINAINESYVVIFACSDNSLSSDYCEREVTYARNTGKKVIPYLLPGAQLKDWFLFDFGNINCINSTKEDEVNRMIEDLKNWKRREEGEEGHIDSSSNYNQLETGNSFNSNPDSTSNPNSSSNTNPIIHPIPTQNTPNLSNPSNNPQDASTIGTIKGHTYVDLGLPSGVKWATCNVGAFEPEEYGDYFAWGEVEPKKPYDKYNCPAYNKDIDWLRAYGYIGQRMQLEMSHDPARELWGGTWRMPSRKEVQELIGNCEWTWKSHNFVNGYQVKSKINGNSIFFPTAGYMDGVKRRGLSDKGFYWSSSANDGAIGISFALTTTSHGFSLGIYARYFGLPIRPVTDW